MTAKSPGNCVPAIPAIPLPAVPLHRHHRLRQQHASGVKERDDSAIFRRRRFKLLNEGNQIPQAEHEGPFVSFPPLPPLFSNILIRAVLKHVEVQVRRTKFWDRAINTETRTRLLCASKFRVAYSYCRVSPQHPELLFSCHKQQTADDLPYQLVALLLNPILSACILVLECPGRRSSNSWRTSSIKWNGKHAFVSLHHTLNIPPW